MIAISSFRIWYHSIIRSSKSSIRCSCAATFGHFLHLSSSNTSVSSKAVEITNMDCNNAIDNCDIIRRVDVIKGREDRRLYRGLVLANQLKVLLVSDAETEKSAAALEVNVGHLSDPDNLNGLAHFCEHMLFLGTKKYPVENEYSKFLSEHGGFSNACTTDDKTQYYFDVLPEHLPGALDRFAQFFLSPLFTESGTEREINAVNSEHEKNIPSDDWRLLQLQRHVSKPGHSYRKFGTGNKETLWDNPRDHQINVREELLKFHEKWYSANLMTLSVLGKESLDELEALVLPLFKSVVNKQVAAPEWPEHPLGPEQTKVQVFAVPIKDIRTLHLSFPIPDFRDFYKTSPCHYISHLIGHEGKGSLLSALKARGWCNTLSAGERNPGKGFSFFGIAVDLTPEALNHIEEVITLIFQYIEMLRKEGPKKWIFEEEKDIYYAAFHYKDKENPCKYVSRIASDMHYFPLEETLIGNHYLTDWKPDLITQVLGYLNPSNFIVAAVAKKYESIADQSEPIYGTKYKFEKITPAVIQKWELCGTTEELQLPAPNLFIPSTYDVLPIEESTKHPFILYDSAWSRIWFKQDDEFLLPKAQATFGIYSPLAYLDPLNYNLTVLFSKLLQDDLNEFAYDALLAGLHFNILCPKYGIYIKVYGYSDKQHVLLKKIFEKAVSFQFDDKRFEIIKEKHFRELRNFDREQPYQQAIYYMSTLTSEHAWLVDELLSVENQLTAVAMRDFIPHLFSKCKIEGLLHGNFDRQRALTVAKIPEETLRAGQNAVIPLLPRQLIRPREIQIANGFHYNYNLTNKHHKSSGIDIYYQCCTQNTQTNMELELLLQIIREPCFNILRTQEQLGYIVHSGINRASGVQGLMVLLQSDRHPLYLNQRIEAFFLHVRELLVAISDEEFESHRKALAALRLEKPKNLLKRTDKYWSEISTQQYHFDRDDVEVAYLRTITKEQILTFFDTYLAIDGPQRKKLAVNVISEAEGGAGTLPIPDVDSLHGCPDGFMKPPSFVEPQNIEDVTRFKSSQGLYPLPQPYIAINGSTKSKL